MNVAQVINTLASMGVTVTPGEGGSMRLLSKSETVPPEAIELARAHRDDLRPLLDGSECIHVPPFDALEEPIEGSPGWVRVTCRRCGGYIGRGKSGYTKPKSFRDVGSDGEPEVSRTRHRIRTAPCNHCGEPTTQTICDRCRCEGCGRLADLCECVPTSPLVLKNNPTNR